MMLPQNIIASSILFNRRVHFDSTLNFSLIRFNNDYVSGKEKVQIKSLIAELWCFNGQHDEYYLKGHQVYNKTLIKWIRFRPITTHDILRSYGL